MIEVTGIPNEDGENCIDIYKICELISVNKKNQRLKSPAE